jgi:hypothetical protein
MVMGVSKEKVMSFSSVMDDIGSNGHLPIGFVIFLVGALVYCFHGLDASFVTFTGSVLTFLGAHMYVQNNNKGSDGNLPSSTPANPVPTP